MSIMRGIQFIYDNQGNKTTAVVDLRRHGKAFAAFLQQLANETSSTTTTPVVGDTLDNIGSNNNTLNTKQLKIDGLIQKARSYYGVPYRTGGTTQSGMDCSGFLQTTFKAIGIELPRVSRDQAQVGAAVSKNQLKEGDLIFFATGTPGRINHVGMVTNSSNPDDVKFIHASSSRGVMETTLGLGYWQKAYIQAKRLV